MLLTVTTTHHPATDLGFLLHKNPERAQVFPQSYGQAHVIYPEATEARTTVALLLEIDPIALVRGAKGRADFALGQYVNDRPYAASSLLAVALGSVFRTAMRGECKPRPELAATPIPLEVGVPALPCRGGVPVVTELFAPLGWAVDAVPVPLDPAFPEWGDSRYVRLVLRGTMRLADALNHLYHDRAARAGGQAGAAGRSPACGGHRRAPGRRGGPSGRHRVRARCAPRRVARRLVVHGDRGD